MRYSYKSNGIVSRSIRDYRDSLLSDFSNFRVWEGDKEFTEGQYQTVRISDVNYGTVGDYGSHGIGSRNKGSGVGSDTQIASGGIHIVGEKGTTYFSGSAVCYPKYASKTNISCFGTGANRYCIYSYEAGNVSETVGQHGSSVINAGIGARRIDSFQFVFDVWQPISRFVGAAECRVYNYEPCITEDYNELDYGLITANATVTQDYGSVSGDITEQNNYGHILDGYKTRFGFSKVIGEAQAKATNAWIGSGRIRKFGRQTSPAIYGYIADGKVRCTGTADVSFTTSDAGGGLTPLRGSATIGITAICVGDGHLRKFGGSAESLTWNPEEKQMLFSFIGGLTSEKHTESYRGSGRIKNLAKVEAEKGTFTYTGSGFLKLRPRKPSVYWLADIANLTLEVQPGRHQKHENFGDITYGWTGTTQLGGVLLKDLTEFSHEKHTECYTKSSFVSSTELDYGNLVQSGSTNCVAVSGTISTNTTAATGCTQVAPGTTLAIATGNTYTIPALQTTPTSSEDYGLVTESNAGQRDYGWILDTSDLRTPYGRGLRFTSQVEVNVNHTYHWTSDGTPPIFKIIGDTTLPLDVTEEGSGTLFSMGGAVESRVFALGSTGLFRFVSFTHVSRARDFVGFGTLRKISGAAESITWNPEERQILFDVLGVGTQAYTRNYIGSGYFSTLSSATETVRWSAQHTTGLYRISGDSDDTRARAFAGSGSLRKFSGFSESITVNPDEKQMLFSFTGGITSEKHTEAYVGSGRIRNLATLQAEKQTFDWVGSGTIKLHPRKPQKYLLSDLGSFTLDFYSLKSAFINLGYFNFYNGANTNLGSVELKWLSYELSHEKHTEAYNNGACEDGVTLDYGNLVNQANLNCVANSGIISTNTTATTGCIKVAPGTTLAIATGSTYTIPSQTTTPTDSEDYGLITDHLAGQRDYGHILDSLGKVCPYGAFEITGAAKTHYVENFVSTGYSISGRCAVNIFGEADTFWTPPYIGDGLGRLVGTLTESFTPAPHIGSGVLFSMGGAGETTAVIFQGDGLFRIGGASIPLFSLLHPGSGLIRITGEGSTTRTRPFIGSGSLKKFSGAAESITWNPDEKQMLFSFTGEHTVKFVADPPEEGTEIRIGDAAFPTFFVPKYPGSGLIRITGEGDTDRTRVFVGSGSLKKFSGAAESITFNPEEKQMLFSFTGSGTERVTLNPPEEGTEIRLRGEGISVGERAYYGSGRIPVFGEGSTPRTRPFVGSGSLKKFSGAAESLTFNPEERQMLFSFTGAGTERVTLDTPDGDGRLFSFNGAVESRAVSDDIAAGLFRIDGDSDDTRSRSFVGSGTFKKFSGAAESITWNPDEHQMLFDILGIGEQSKSVSEIGSGSIKIRPEASDYRFTPNWNSKGGIRIRVQSTYRFAPVWIGSGSIPIISGAAESLTFNPEEKQMLFSFTGTGEESRTSREISQGGTIRLDGTPRVRWVPNNVGSGTVRVSGDAKTHWTPHVIGSGGLWSWAGAAESISISPAGLYTILKVQGTSPSSRSVVYTGSGSLKKFQGAAESITWNPDERQMLFSFLGNGSFTRTRTESGQGRIRIFGEAIAKFSPVFIGSGTTRLSGEATVTRTRDFVGFGTLRKISGAAESITWNPEEKQMLFSFLGDGTQSRTSKLLSQGGVLTVRGTSGDPLLTFAEQGRVEIDIAGDSIDLRTHAYHGSGRISNVNNVDASFTRAGYKGSGRIAISGIAFVQVVVWQPPNTQVWII